MNFVDVLITSPSTFITKVWGQDRRICCLILGVKGSKGATSSALVSQDEGPGDPYKKQLCPPSDPENWFSYMDLLGRKKPYLCFFLNHICWSLVKLSKISLFTFSLV